MRTFDAKWANKVWIRILFILSVQLVLVSSSGYSQDLPDLSSIDPRVQRMVEDRSKSFQTLLETRFLPFGYDSSSVETDRGKVTVFLISPEEYYSFRKGSLLEIELELFNHQDDSVWKDDLQEVFHLLGHPSHELASTHGHLSRVFVYPSSGLAFHSVEFEMGLKYVEVFPPMSYRKYKRLIWQDPERYDRDAEKLYRLNHRHERK